MKLYFIPLLLLWSSAFAQTKISAEKASIAIKKDTTIQLLDVRTKKEYDSKHIQQALHADWKDQTNFESFVQYLDKSKPVYVYCLSGGRSAEAAKKLTALGYTVYGIEGGIMKWEATALPIIQGHERQQEDGMSIEAYNGIIQQNNIVLVDFYASWCPPCKKLSPIVDAIATKYSGKVTVLKINIDDNDKLYKSLNISGIPMLLIYKGGVNTWSSKGFTELKIFIPILRKR